MEDNNAKVPTNVIQFPGGKRKETPVANSPAPKAEKPAKKKRTSKKTVAGSVLAIILATGAVNRYAFSAASTGAATMASSSHVGRAIASVDNRAVTRNADWERELAERFASAQKRDVASLAIGRAPTAEEKLRWGTLEEKYTIKFREDIHEIDSIILQNQGESHPSYVLNRETFLNDYGTLLKSEFTSAKLKSVETINDKTIETYVLFGKSSQPAGQARFELDQHQRFLSLKVEPAQI